MAASGDGYQVRHAGMTSQAKQLDLAGDDADDINRLLAGTPCYSQEVLGGDDMGPAFSAYSTAWNAESKTIADALHQLAGKVRGAKGAYGGSDGLVQTRARAVQVGTRPTHGAPPVGTNPVHGTNPVGDTAPVTTGPAYAERPSALTDY